ncbi:Heat shock factor protein [Araneus ventricosus]|uniref:Heat shock factor protein n=1 Tax=Araneus ventricosus TaxID=182803 RepID=A0A4Y2NXX1_ARAVE|nr:Heat shock factor protein [Araneus ventricosus]
MPYAMHSFESNSSNVPAFLVKLWKLVEDPNCDDLIAWSDNGYSFIIKDQARFAKELLPQYFKHNNMASFIRQLNMYGFKKVMNYEKTGLRNENNEMEFQHGFFIKERSELLELIKRKISNPKVPDPPSKTNAKDILIDLTSIREKQENMDSMLLKMKQENELLWRELTAMRQKHKAQEQIIQKTDTNEDCAKTLASTENKLAEDANTSFIEEKSVKGRSPPKQGVKRVNDDLLPTKATQIKKRKKTTSLTIKEMFQRVSNNNNAK